MLEDSASDNLIVGLRRSVKTIESGEAEKAYVAEDIAPGLYEDFTALCEQFNVPCQRVQSKAALGKACHIDVGASVAVVRKD